MRSSLGPDASMQLLKLQLESLIDEHESFYVYFAAQIAITAGDDFINRGFVGI